MSGLFVCLPREHNGHARRKKHVVELYCFVAHAQHNASRTIEGEALGKRTARISPRLKCDRKPERRQDREDSGRDLEAEGREVIVRVRARRAKLEQREGNQERASTREKTKAGR